MDLPNIAIIAENVDKGPPNAPYTSNTNLISN